MKTTQKLMYVIMIAVIAAFASCKGETGPAGPAGADGTNGTNGVDGTDGNANVIASPWITPTWSATGVTSGYFVYAETAITKDFMSTGVLLSYMNWSGDTTYVYSVPFTFRTGGGTVSFNDEMQEGQIKWWFTAENNYTPNSGAKFRYVLIPASAASKSANPQQEILYNLDRAGVDVNNYYQVMDYFGLKY